MKTFDSLMADIRACELCKASLPFGPRPIVQADPEFRILIVGQAPGRKVHESGVPFDDVSGDRLREWLGMSREDFYNPKKVAILPMGFCYPGTGKSGDLPPRPECAPAWREQLLGYLQSIELMVVIGQYAQANHLEGGKRSVTEHVKAWWAHWPAVVPLPHPSPRNNRWLARNHWFEVELLPQLKQRVQDVLSPGI